MNSFGICQAIQGAVDHHGTKVVRDIVLTCVVLPNMLRSHQGKQIDHPLQLMTYNHHRGTRVNRDIMKT